MANKSKYSFNEVERKLDIIRDDKGAEKVLLGDGTYGESPLTRKLTEVETNLTEEINVERKRIDNLASLEEGSTTGDAELIDARVDKNGNTHTNVGEHIRSATNQLSSEIENVERELKETLGDVYVGEMTQGYYLKNDDSVISNDESSISDYIPVLGGADIRIKDIFVETVRAVMVYKASKMNIGVIITDSAETEVTYTLPENAEYIRITSRIGVTPTVEYINTSDLLAKINAQTKINTNQFDTTLKEINNGYIDVYTEHKKNYLVNQNGQEVYDTSSSVTDFIKVSEGERLKIDNIFVVSSRSICTYNADKTFRRCVITDKTRDLTSYIFNALKGDEYIRITGKRDVDVSIKKEMRNYDETKIRKILSKKYEIEYANADSPMVFKNCYDSIQNVHPKVLYFADTLFNHRYWMAYTPYPKGDVSKENPCIAYSEDGYNWTNIANNPIDDWGGDANIYNSDTHLVYNPNTRKLECWYRVANATDNTETIYRMTSSDGSTWGDKEQLFYSTDGHSKCLSPAVIYEDNVYKIWIVSKSDDGIYHVKYYTSVSGNDWVLQNSIYLDFVIGEEIYKAWHVDVEKIDDKYYMLVMCKNSDSTKEDWTIFGSESSDEVTFSVPKVVLLPKDGNWDSKMYRACMVKADNNYRIYYSALKKSTYGIGISVADTMWKFFGTTD